MNLKTTCIILVCTFVQFFAFSQPNTKPISPPPYEAGAVWVKVKPAYKAIFEQSQAVGRAPSKINASKIQPFLKRASRNKSTLRIAPQKLHVDISSYYKLNFDTSLSVEDLVKDLDATGYFEIVEPVYLEQILLTPNDPLISQQYYLNLIHAFEAWDITQGNPSIVIGIVDTGGDLDHPDLQNNIYIDPADPTDGIDNDGDGYIDNNRGWDFSGSDASLIGTPGFVGDNDPSITKGNVFVHGTLVAGCASATTNNGVGISGIGFNTKLLFTKHFADSQPDNSTQYSSDTYSGILYAATHGAKIINCSWGRSTRSVIAQDIITYVTLDLGCLVVAAAGNSDSEGVLYPAGYDHVLSVASSDWNDNRSPFSNYGKTVDIIAPGEDIYTTDYNNAYRIESGTSLAAPLVSGAAALVWARNPQFSALQVAEQIRISADTTFYANNPAYKNKLGYGRLDVARALTLQTPSIRAHKQLLVNENGVFPEAGESCKLFFEFTNYLMASTPGLSVVLSSSSPHVAITQDLFILGVMGEGSTISNSDKPFELMLAPDLPSDTPIEMLLTFSDGNYRDFQLVSFILPTFIDVDENNITTTITSSGRIGFGNAASQANGSGFIYNEQPLLYEMGLIMGTSAAAVFDNVRGTGGDYNQDFTAVSKIVKGTPGERSYSEIAGTFRNAAVAGSESLLISYRSLVWRDDPYKNFVILEYKIKNTTLDPLTNFYMGIFADWDIVEGGAGDRASWDGDTRLGYVFPAQQSNLPQVGIQSLNTSAQYYAIDNDPTLPGNTFGLYDGFTDAEKFTSISGGLGKTDAGGSLGNDVSHVVGSGPYTIAAGEEITIAFALHAATNTTELINSAKYADSLYNYTLQAPKPSVESIEACYGTNATLQATGATNFNWYTNFLGGTPVFSGSQFTIPDLKNDTVLYVSNADEHYESLRTPASILSKPAPSIAHVGDLEFCDGGSLNLSTNLSEDYTWSTGEKTQTIQVGLSGDYSVAVKQGQLECVSSDVHVTVYPEPIPSFTFSPEVVAEGDNIIFSNESEGAVTFLWDFGDGSTSAEENPSHAYSTTGDYSVSLVALSDKGCQATESKSLGIITGTEPLAETLFETYPNPAASQLIVKRRGVTNEPADLFIINAQGDYTHRIKVETHETQQVLDVSNFASGIYLVRIISGGKTSTQKIVIAH